MSTNSEIIQSNITPSWIEKSFLEDLLKYFQPVDRIFGFFVWNEWNIIFFLEFCWVYWLKLYMCVSLQFLVVSYSIFYSYLYIFLEDCIDYLMLFGFVSGTLDILCCGKKVTPWKLKHFLWLMREVQFFTNWRVIFGFQWEKFVDLI